MKAHGSRTRLGPVIQRGNGLPWTKPHDRISRLRRADLPHILTRHREVDVGHVARDVLVRSRRHPERSEGSAHENQILRTWETVLRMTRGPGTGPPVGCDRARESIRRARNTCNLPKVKGNAKRTLGRCKATRSCASDAMHEFPRIRSAGLFPMIPYRRSGYPQLLLMQPTLWSRREVDDTQTRKAFS